MDAILPDETVQYKEFISVDVGDPEVQTINSEKFASYAITLKTNSLSFAAPHSRVHRRYNEFLWLQRRLKKIPALNTSLGVPNLPRKQFSFWNFDGEFLQRRRDSLQEFLSKIIEETLFLSSTSFHLFIQTELTVSEMEEIIAKGECDNALTRHVKSIKVDDAFLESMKSRLPQACDSKTNEFAADDTHTMPTNHLPVYWRCQHNTIKKVASLPHFDAILNEYDVVINNNANDVETEVATRIN